MLKRLRKEKHDIMRTNQKKNCKKLTKKKVVMVMRLHNVDYNFQKNFLNK